jgi:hypothetical protein
MDRRLPLAAAALLVLALAAAPAAHAKTRSVTCAGGAKRCTATVNLAGLKKGDKVAIDLTDTDLALRSIKPSRPSVQAAYGFEGMSTRLGGSQFVVQFLIIPPVPKGASVRFRFAVPPKMTACGDDQFTVAGAQVRLTDVEGHGLGCMAARRVAEGCVSGVGPGRGWVPAQVDDTVILWRGRQRVTFGAGSAPATCVPSG